MKVVKIFIDKYEFQSKILDLISSEELNKYIDNSVYKDNKDAKGAVTYGMALASMQTCRCQQYLVEKEPEKSEDVSTNQSSTEGVYHKWVYADTIAGMRYYRCSNCDDIIETLANENEVKWWKFCPRCGVKMFIKEEK